jgi:hypothetical protein
MKKGIKSGILHGGLPKLTGKRKSSSNMRGESRSRVRSAGSEGDASGGLLSISLYDSCYVCPLSVYIDVTVDDKLERLVIAGSASRAELEEVKLRLITEFSELSGNGEVLVFNEILNSYYKHRALIAGLEASLRLLASGRFEAATEYLNKNGVKCCVPGGDEEAGALIERVRLKLKSRMAKFRELSGRYELLSRKGERPTRRYYNRLLVTLSTCEVIKMQLNAGRMTVAEFAEYLNVYNEYQNRLIMNRNGKYGNNR